MNKGLQIVTSDRFLNRGVLGSLGFCKGYYHVRLYNNPGMNPLSPNWVIVFYFLSIYRVSRIITYDKYGAQAWLLVAGKILQPICNLQLRFQKVHRSQEQVNNTSTC